VSIGFWAPFFFEGGWEWGREDHFIAKRIDFLVACPHRSPFSKQKAVVSVCGIALMKLSFLHSLPPYP
jgi:hypothetical protein